MKYIITLVVCLLALPVYGQSEFLADGRLGVGLVLSKHADKNFDYESKHIVVGYYHEKTPLVAALVLPNSYGDPALTIGGMFRTKWYGPIQGEVYLGAVIGYGDHIWPSYAGVSAYGWAGLGAKTPVKDLTIRFRAIPNVYTLGIDYLF